MSEITIKLDDTEVKKKIFALEQGIKDFQKPLSEIGDELLEFYGNTVIESQGVEIGDPYRKMTAGTIRARLNRWGYYAQMPIRTDKILIWTGRLQKGFFKEVSKLTLKIGNKVPYFKYHQVSTGRPPQRKMLGITSKVIEKVVSKLNDYANNLLK